jgi:hypothetical protein
MAFILLGGVSWMHGGGKLFCCINDSIGGCYLWDWDGMMLEAKCVSDPLATCVSHENWNASIVICGM